MTYDAGNGLGLGGMGKAEAAFGCCRVVAVFLVARVDRYVHFSGPIFVYEIH